MSVAAKTSSEIDCEDSWETRSTVSAISTRSYVSRASQENGMYLVNHDFSYEDYIALVLGKDLPMDD